MRDELIDIDVSQTELLKSIEVEHNNYTIYNNTTYDFNGINNIFGVLDECCLKRKHIRKNNLIRTIYFLPNINKREKKCGLISQHCTREDIKNKQNITIINISNDDTQINYIDISQNELENINYSLYKLDCNNKNKWIFIGNFNNSTPVNIIAKKLKFVYDGKLIQNITLFGPHKNKSVINNNLTVVIESHNNNNNKINNKNNKNNKFSSNKLICNKYVKQYNKYNDLFYDEDC